MTEASRLGDCSGGGARRRTGGLVGAHTLPRQHQRHDRRRAVVCEDEGEGEGEARPGEAGPWSLEMTLAAARTWHLRRAAAAQCAAVLPRTGVLLLVLLIQLAA